MLPVLNKPILEYIVNILSQNHVKELYIIVNNKNEMIRNYFEDGSEFNVSIDYICQNDLNGIASAISLVDGKINEPFVTILGDTFLPYLHLNSLYKIFYKRKAIAVQALVKELDQESLKQSCNVEIEQDGKIKRLVEKPVSPSTSIRGAGVYLFSPKIFDFIKDTSLSLIRNEVEITDTLNLIARRGKCYGEFLEIPDININTKKDLLNATIIMLHSVK